MLTCLISLEHGTNVRVIQLGLTGGGIPVVTFKVNQMQCTVLCLSCTSVPLFLSVCLELFLELDAILCWILWRYVGVSTALWAGPA